MAKVRMRTLFERFRDSTVLSRCEQYGEWTLPYLTTDIQQMTASGRVVVERDFQEAGALLTNALASKLTKVLFPTQVPFFRCQASESLKKAASRKGYGEDELRTEFARAEVRANERLFINAGYAGLLLAVKHLIVTGNVLLHRNSKEGTVTAYGLRNFSTRRAGDGSLLDCILREFTTVEALPPDLQSALRTANSSMYSRPEQQVEKFTRIHRVTRNGEVGYEVSQEVDTIPVGEPGWYPKLLCPWIVPTWTLIPGEHYGRGMVEDYAGGFAKLSALSESAALYGIEIMKMLHLVSSGAGSDLDEMAAAEMGEWVRGQPKDVQAHEGGDAQKLAAVEAQIQTVLASLSRAFMYNGPARDAERVTMYELRQQASEVEATLGGVYSALSGGLQVPLGHVLITEVDDLALAGLISGDLRLEITAGIPALGRANDVQNLLGAAQELAAIMPVVQLDKRIDPKRVVDIILAGRSIDPSTIFFTPEEQQANSAAAQAEANAQQSLIAAGTLADQGEQLQQTMQG